ncbi:MAG TPA: cold shock domain-containing protein [Chloroflexota bacterium]|jgi:CspA family cold shock protein|nr:cold shock domain-containing protein [Chloroflexota bacterium]
MKGRVKWFSPERGYGFIVTEQGEDAFVHYTGIPGTGYRSLEQGQCVEFEITTGAKGAQATNVRVVESRTPGR